MSASRSRAISLTPYSFTSASVRICERAGAQRRAADTSQTVALVAVGGRRFSCAHRGAARGRDLGAEHGERHAVGGESCGGILEWEARARTGERDAGGAAYGWWHSLGRS